MAIEPISIRDLEARTDDVYEAVVVMTKRSKQIIHERLVDKALEAGIEDDYLAMDEIPVEKDPEDYVEKDKPTTVAISNFLDNKIKWHYLDKLEI